MSENVKKTISMGESGSVLVCPGNCDGTVTIRPELKDIPGVSAAEALRGACGDLFAGGCACIVCCAPVQDAETIRLLQQCSFRREGVLRGRSADGDVVSYSLLKEEYEEMTDPVPEGIVIRRMRASDYQGLTALWDACPGVSRHPVDDSEEKMTELIDRNPDLNFVAVAEGRVVGSLMGSYDGRRGYLYHAAVLPEYRGKGIARALFETEEKAMREQGSLKTALLTFAANEAGNAFWDHIGFSRRTDTLYRSKPTK